MMKQQLAKKVDKIAQTSRDIDKMKQITGHQDTSGDMSRELFQLLGLLELYSSAYLEADCFFARHHNTSSVVNPPKDRLLCYLQLVSQIKRVAQGGGIKKKDSSMSVKTQGSAAAASKGVSLEGLDVTDKIQLTRALSGASLSDVDVEYLYKLI